MEKYFRLVVAPSLTCGYLEQINNQSVKLIRGIFVDPSSLEQPFLLKARPSPKHDMIFDDWYSNRYLMSKRLVQTLEFAGVSNLQLFPAEIEVPGTPKPNLDFFVVNIVGIVACADPSKSDATPLADVKYFFKLSIDPSRPKDAFMFRLAESRTDVIVVERVAKAIEAGAFRNIRLEPVS